MVNKNGENVFPMVTLNAKNSKISQNLHHKFRNVTKEGNTIQFVSLTGVSPKMRKSIKPHLYQKLNSKSTTHYILHSFILHRVVYIF